MKKNKSTETEPLLSKEEMDNLINRIIAVYTKLNYLLEQWCEIRDSKK